MEPHIHRSFLIGALRVRGNVQIEAILAGLGVSHIVKVRGKGLKIQALNGGLHGTGGIGIAHMNTLPGLRVHRRFPAEISHGRRGIGHTLEQHDTLFYNTTELPIFCINDWIQHDYPSSEDQGAGIPAPFNVFTGYYIVIK